jgi:hypothetical protein
MKWLSLVILNGALLIVSAQMNEGFGCYASMRHEPVVIASVPNIGTRPLTAATTRPTMPEYDLDKVNRNLKLDRRLIIAGAVLTGVGGVFFGVGVAGIFSGGDEDFLAFGMLMAGAPLIGVGVPLLGVGLAQRHKWRQRQNQLNLQTGFLPNGHAGLALQF